jgi:DNA polymerase I-like protein with 3'-5' exonuclease and polymerase domains
MMIHTEKFQLRTKSVLLIDIETNLAHNRITLVVTKDVENGEVITWTHPEGFADYIAGYDTMVAHNGVAFDFPVLNRVWNTRISLAKVLDTLVLSRLANPSMLGGHSLKNWGIVLGVEKIDFQGDFDAEMTPELIEYCKQDVEVLHSVYNTVCKELVRLEFSQYSVELEHSVAAIVSKQERTGFLFDMKEAMLLNTELYDKLKDMLTTLQVKYPPVVHKRISEKTGKPLKDKVVEFNPASRQMIADVLMAAGVKLTKMTEKGSYIIDEETLSGIDHPDAKLFAEYMMLQKRQSQLDSWFKAVKDDNRVHGKVITNGAVTGRMTHHSPNMAQVPSCSSPYGAECRALWTVPAGYKLVGADASGLELRMLAHYMGDPDYTNEVVNGDIHTKNQLAAGLETRPQAKTFIYAFLYGAGDSKIGSVVNGGSAVGKRLKEQFLASTPALKKLIEKVQRLSRKGYLPGLDGRKVMVRSEHAALNTLLQSAGAIVMKQALVILDKKIKSAKIDAQFVANVHDEWQIEVAEKDADTVGKMATESITEAGLFFEMRCPLAGEYKVGSNWKETH